VYRCEYHFVWIPKYRYQVLIKEIKSRLKQILIELCEWLDIDITEGAIASDHVHMYCSVPPKYAPSQVMKVLKGKSAEYLRRDFPELKKKILGPAPMGTRLFCQHCRYRQGSNPQLCQRSARKPNPRRATAIMERQQRMTLSGVAVLQIPPTRSVVVYI